MELASGHYRDVVDAMGGQPNIVEASWAICRELEIDNKLWGEACAEFGRERAALCVMIIDRNWRLPEDHTYHRNNPGGTLRGMIRKGNADLNLTGMLMALRGYEKGTTSNVVPLHRSQRRQFIPGVKSVAAALPLEIVQLLDDKSELAQ